MTWHFIICSSVLLVYPHDSTMPLALGALFIAEAMLPFFHI
jgi:hypothetical protein